VSRYRHLTLFVALAVLWGVSYPAIDAGLPFFPPVLFAACRYYAGGLLLLAYVVVARDDWRPRTRSDWTAVLVAGTFLVGGNGLVFVGQQFTNGAVASVVFSLVPILTTAFAWTLLPTRPHSPTGIAGVVLGLVGVAIIARPAPNQVVTAGVLGPAVVLLAAVSVSLGSVLLDRGERTLSVVPLTAWAMLVGGVMLNAVGLGLGESPAAIDPTLTAVVAVLYLGIFASAVAYIVYFDLLARYGPLEVNLVAYASPVVAAVAGWLLLAEPITPTTVGGFAVILAGFVLLKRRELRALAAVALA